MSLFVLPFDHRATFAKELLGFSYPNLTEVQRKKVCAMKQVVFDGFLTARGQTDHPEKLALLVDEEFGSKILKEAKKKKIHFALSVEKSGQQVFDFEYGAKFADHIKKWNPSYAKVLVRYDEREDNTLQLFRLKQLSDFCTKEHIGYMMEVLLQNGSRIETVMKEMLAYGIKPSVWKIEGLTTVAEWKRLDKITKIDSIVLGHGDSRAHVEQWLTIAAKSGISDGFAVGRTVFLKTLMDLRDKKIDRAEAVNRIAKNFLHFLHLWGRALKS